ncbi:MAG: CBS domain-containing protein [Nitrospinaceae bacterium]
MQVITSHLSADLDSLASMMGARKLYPEARLVFPGSVEPPLQQYLTSTGMDQFLTRLTQIELSQVTHLIVVDTQNPQRLGVLGTLVGRDGVTLDVFDHHVGVETPLSPDRCVVRTRGACTTVLLEEIRKQGLALEPEEATLMLLGIYQDTQMLTSTSTTPEDLEAAAELLRAGADLRWAADFLDTKLGAHQVAVLNDLVSHLTLENINGTPIGFAAARMDDYVPDLAVVVSRLLNLENFDALFAAVAHQNRVILIGRSRVESVDVGLVLRAFGGGGHPQAGSANVTGRTPEQVTHELRQVLEERVDPPRLVGDIMHAPPITVKESETVETAEKRLTRFNVNSLPVVSGKKPVGLLTRQMVEKAMHHQLEKEPVSQIMTREFSSATPESLFKSVAPIIIEDKQTLVPVVESEDGSLVGVVARGDLLRHLHLAIPHSIPLLDPGRRAVKNVKSLMVDRLPRRVMDLLNRVSALAHRRQVRAYVVGGFVRDLLLGLPNLDTDLVVEGDGLGFAKELGKELQARVVSHQKFGTSVLLLPGGLRIDVATARAEYYQYPAALPTVKPGSLKLDMFRRDFTLNSMAIRLNGSHEFTLVDHFNGQRDLKEKVVRVLHNLSFLEDPTRAFRAIRFEVRLGFRMGPQTEAFLRQAVRKDWIARLSGHRLFNEVRAMLAEARPLACIHRMRDLGLLPFLHPRLLAAPADWEALARLEKVLSFSTMLKTIGQPEAWVVYLLGMLLGLDAPAFRETAKRLDWTRKLRERLQADLEHCRETRQRLQEAPEPSPSEVFTLFSRGSPESCILLMAAADCEKVNRLVMQYYTQYRPAAVLALSGEDLIELGLRPGPVFQTVFEALREARLTGQVRSREEEEALVRRRFL